MNHCELNFEATLHIQIHHSIMLCHHLKQALCPQDTSPARLAALLPRNRKEQWEAIFSAIRHRQNRT